MSPSDAADGTVLEGGHRRVVRRGAVVHSPAGPWSASVHALLRHLESEGFSAAPRVVGTGFDEQGCETLGFVPGESPHPHAWSNDAAVAVGALLRDLHRASASFRPPRDARWQPWFVRELPISRPVFGHCDKGPWNILAREGRPVALVDWEFAGPVDARWELAYTAWLNAQLHDDDVAQREQLPDLTTRARQVRLILDGYGLPARDRAGFVDALVEVAVRGAAQEAIDAKVEPGAEPERPVLWAITWRTRGAAWMLRHRRALEQALA